MDRADEGSEFLYEQMLDRKPSLKAYNALLSAWEESSSPDVGDEALDILRRIKSDGLEPNPLTYLYVFAIFANSSRHCIEAKNLLDKMNDSECQVDQDHYDYAVQAFVKCEDWVGCREIMLRRSNAGFPPTIETYNDHVFRICKPELAEELLLTMKGPSVNAESYNAVFINVFENLPRRIAFDTANRLYKNMIDAKISPSGETYAVLISHFAQHNLERADDILQDAECNIEQDPNYRHFRPLTKAYIKQRQHRKAGLVLLRWASRYLQTNKPEIQPRPRDIDEVVTAWLVAGDLVGATNLLVTLHNKFPLSIFQATYELVVEAWKESRRKDRHKPIKHIQTLIRSATPGKELEDYQASKQAHDLASMFERPSS